MPHPVQPPPRVRSSEEEFEPVDALTPTMKCVAVMTGFGAFIASAQATLTKSNIGAFGPFRYFGGTIVQFAALGATYEFTRHASANLRRKHDSYNEAIGGFMGGALLGLRMRTLPAVLGFGSALAVFMTAFDVTGGTLMGPIKDLDVDEYERKEALRANKRRPIQETIDELGEGRGRQPLNRNLSIEALTDTGIFGPGYEERRRQRIRERYGIEIPTTTPS
ncbi:MAG: hypothetical protein M1828_003801 [Chrysothrix sp. TS-e1954]|nr:MAG: hypothetical protein M1828_003801 [Chrysothrix sp. TS-e1954]